MPTTDPNKEINVDHSLTPPTDKSRCLLCLDVIDGPFVTVRVGKTFNIKADDECWDQLTDMVDQVREARTSREGELMH